MSRRVVRFEAADHYRNESLDSSVTNLVQNRIAGHPAHVAVGKHVISRSFEFVEGFRAGTRDPEIVVGAQLA